MAFVITRDNDRLATIPTAQDVYRQALAAYRAVEARFRDADPAYAKALALELQAAQERCLQAAIDARAERGIDAPRLRPLPWQVTE